MQKVKLGRTGLDVSVAGLGGGGSSRLGLSQGKSNEEAAEIVRAAFNLGITYFDTATNYKSEEAMGIGLKGHRDKVVLATKAPPTNGPMHEGDLITGQQMMEECEASLKRLQTDYIDVYQIHGAHSTYYDYCVSEYLPALTKLKEQGKIRFFGITERFVQETNHDMVQLVLKDAYFDTIMLGFNIINPSARNNVFPLTQQKNIGTQIMFAVRRALSQPYVLADLVNELLEKDELDAEALAGDKTLNFLAEHPEIKSVIEASYRFVRHEPGADVVLMGTGSAAHLKDNVAAITAPPLPPEIQARLKAIFGRVTSASGN